MASSLSNIVNNLSEGIHKVKSKYGENEKKNKKLAELSISIGAVFLSMQT